MTPLPTNRPFTLADKCRRRLSASVDGRWAFHCSTRCDADKAVCIITLVWRLWRWCLLGDLHFAYARLRDQLSDDKVYKCVVFNPHLDLQAGGSYTRVIVTPSGVVHSFTPTCACAHITWLGLHQSRSTILSLTDLKYWVFTSMLISTCSCRPATVITHKINHKSTWRRSWAVARVLTPWKYVGGVRVCFEPLKYHIFHSKLLLDNSV